MEWKKLFLFVLTWMQIVYQCWSASIDEIISNAAQTPKHVAQKGAERGTIDDKTSDIKVELDMILTPEQWAEMQSGEQTTGRRYRRKALRKESYRWPKGVIPYEMSSDFTYNERQVIFAAMNEWRQNTCLQFREATRSDKNKIRFDNGSGCYSNVGMVGGTRKIGLKKGCRVKKVVLHEIGHAVGFVHEQSRPDRDSYVRIIEENIVPNKSHNFRKTSYNSVKNYNVPYDYKSIMHYGEKYFSVNGLPTIKTVDPKYQDVIGNARGMSFNDIKIANLMYNCNGLCKNRTTRCPGEGYMDKNCRCMCPGNPIRECTNTSSISSVIESPVKSKRETATPYDWEDICKDESSDLCEYLKGRGYCAQVNMKFFFCGKTCNTC